MKHRIEDLLHTNKTQAETIGQLRIELDTLKRDKALAEHKCCVYKIKWERLRKIHLGLKAVLSSLGSTADDFEDFDKED